MTLSPNPRGIQLIEATDLRSGLPLQLWIIPGEQTVALKYDTLRGAELNREQAQDLAGKLMAWACADR